MATYSGGCHCGRVAFDLQADITEGHDCNCSMCSKRGGLLAFFPGEAFTLKTDASAMQTYRFNKQHIAHRFCTTCGIAAFSEGTHPGTGARMVAVNLRCVAGLDLSTLKIVQVDGASF